MMALWDLFSGWRGPARQNTIAKAFYENKGRFFSEGFC